MMFLPLLPLAFAPLFYWAYLGHWRMATAIFLISSAVLAVACDNAAVSLVCYLYALLLAILGIFPLLLRAEIHRASRENLTRKLFLQSEVSEGELSYERWNSKRAKLTEEMERILKHYAFARSLVSHLDEKPILQDLGAIFGSQRAVVGLAFSTSVLLETHPMLFDEEMNQPGQDTRAIAWSPVFSSGWINDAEWSKILRTVQFPLAPETNAVVIDLFNQVGLKPLTEFRGLLLNRDLGEERTEEELKERKKSLFLVGVPVRWDGAVQGLLTFLVEKTVPKELMDEFTVYSQLLSLGLRKIALYRKVLEHSRRDGLTNLYLRHIFLERMNEEINFLKRYGTSFSVLMLDLDHFKSVNDTYGHQSGDKVLKSVADCLKSILHPGVTICRYGGEEFAILVGLAPQDEVMQTAERVRNAIGNLKIRLMEKVTIRITVSVGVAHYLPDMPSPEELIRRADAALYKAKELGRNRVFEWKEKIVTHGH